MYLSAGLKSWIQYGEEDNSTHDLPVVLVVNQIITLSRTPCADSVPKSVPNGTVPADL